VWREARVESLNVNPRETGERGSPGRVMRLPDESRNLTPSAAPIPVPPSFVPLPPIPMSMESTFLSSAFRMRLRRHRMSSSRAGHASREDEHQPRRRCHLDQPPLSLSPPAPSGPGLFDPEGVPGLQSGAASLP